MSKLTSTFTTCATLFLLGIGASPLANAALMFSNFTLTDGAPGFDLAARPSGPPVTPQEFFIGFNSTQMPPGPPVVPNLDFADAGSPLLNNPSTSSNFSVFWGMKTPNPNSPGSGILFNLPMNPTGGLIPPQPVGGTNSFGYSFNATDGTNSFEIFLTITGSILNDAAGWVRIPSGYPTLPAVQFNFSLQSAVDPTRFFIVYENGQQLNFSPAATVPEPPNYTMLLSGLGVMGFTARRRKGFTA